MEGRGPAAGRLALFALGLSACLAVVIGLLAWTKGDEVGCEVLARRDGVTILKHNDRDWRTVGDLTADQRSRLECKPGQGAIVDDR